MLITFKQVEHEYEHALTECIAVYPLVRWAHHPLGVDLTRHKTKYGIAQQDGQVLVSEAFIGTHSLTKLRNTIRHELAHLAAGLWHGHNHIFKKFEREFGALEKVSECEKKAIADNIAYKWHLIAHTVDGKARSVGRVHRRTRRFVDYPQNGVRMKIDNMLIKRFEFVELI